MVCIRSYIGHPTSVQLLGWHRFVFFRFFINQMFSDVLFFCSFVSSMSSSICQSQGMHTPIPIQHAHPTRVARHHRHPSNGYARLPFVSENRAVVSDIRSTSSPFLNTENLTTPPNEHHCSNRDRKRVSSHFAQRLSKYKVSSNGDGFQHLKTLSEDGNF
jgi:hypothetical protein